MSRPAAFPAATRLSISFCCAVVSSPVTRLFSLSQPFSINPIEVRQPVCSAFKNSAHTSSMNPTVSTHPDDIPDSALTKFLDVAKTAFVHVSWKNVDAVCQMLFKKWTPRCHSIFSVNHRIFAASAMSPAAIASPIPPIVFIATSFNRTKCFDNQDNATPPAVVVVNQVAVSATNCAPTSAIAPRTIPTGPASIDNAEPNKPTTPVTPDTIIPKPPNAVPNATKPTPTVKTTAATCANNTTSPRFCSAHFVNTTIASDNADAIVANDGNNALPTAAAASSRTPSSRFHWFSNAPAERIASPCAAVVPRIMIARRAKTFCCSVAFFGSIPWLNSS